VNSLIADKTMNKVKYGKVMQLHNMDQYREEATMRLADILE
jgi:hypothetical protein